MTANTQSLTTEELHHLRQLFAAVIEQRERDILTGDADSYAGGAVRSDRKPRYRDVGFTFVKRIALAFSEGAEKYEKGMRPWEKNWKKGEIEFAIDVLDHAEEHLMLYRERVLAQLNGVARPAEDDGEDHLGHLGANLVMLDYFERMGCWEKGDGKGGKK